MGGRGAGGAARGDGRRGPGLTMTRSFYSHRADHREYGSTGVIINRTKSTTLAEECPEVSKAERITCIGTRGLAEVVGIGGPVGLSSPHDRSVIALTTKRATGVDG